MNLPSLKTFLQKLSALKPHPERLPKIKLSVRQRNILIGALAVLIFTPVAVVYSFRSEWNRAREHAASEQIISIEPGSSTPAILAQLKKEGVLADDFSARMYLRFNAGKRSLKAGDYQFQSPISVREALEKILRGEVATRNFTIPEGYNRYDIARVLGALPGLKQPEPSSYEELLPLFFRVSLISDLDPQADSLEGYLFPDTYEYTASSTRESLIEAMVKRFRRVFTDEMKSRAEELRMSVRQVVTLASLVEKEAKVDAERELISSVFHRRLAIGMPLACDPTVIYAALIEGKYRGKIYRSDLDRDSPYNTYRRAGLPPGPIASPGRRSLQATLNPAETDYLFFVVDATRKDGSHKFSASSADHERAVVALRQWEREQGQR